ncbi:TSUP family transporter [Granulicella sp. 5B5]|uniref:sulfite exporter TauE/SafE family protein n=1 Tax=Granulicella sp. 5B5 TaxID=1617967 RepID=UPI0015F40A53|nr:sulfite exporter TauE/SafE family protein [Granulicella sp. 5B5]QMV19435.1 TSUP family transporter [Granulicella sp. 5B5]
MDYLIGFLIAVVIALTGVGAGVITAPLLILFMHVPLEIAVSTALAYSAIVKLIVVPVQVVRRQVNYRVLGWMLLGGLPGVVIGSLFFKRVAHSGPRGVLYFALGAIIIFTSGWHIYRHFRPAGISRPNEDRSKLIGLIMLPIGAEVGFSSSGAGALGTVALLSMTNLTAPQVVGTDLAFGLVIALVGSGVHMIGGQYATAILIKMAIGGVLGGILASSFAPKIPNRTLRLALSLWLTVIGIQFCYNAVSKSERAKAKPAASSTVLAARKSGDTSNHN